MSLRYFTATETREFDGDRLLVNEGSNKYGWFKYYFRIQTDSIRELHLRRLPEAVHLEAAGNSDHVAREQLDALLPRRFNVASGNDFRLED